MQVFIYGSKILCMNLNNNLNIFLKNGVKLCYTKVKFAKSIYVNVEIFGAGSFYAPDDLPETAHLVEHLIFEGSKNYPTNLIAHQALEANGSFYNATTYRDVISYYLHSPNQGFKSSFAAFIDAICHPNFSDASISSEKEIVREELVGELDNDDRIIYPKIMKSLKREKIHEVKDNIKELNAITRETLINHFQKTHLKNNTTVYLTGNFDPKQLQWVIAQLEKIDLADGERAPIEVLPNHQPEQPVTMHKASKSNIYFSFGRYNLKKRYDTEPIFLDIFEKYLFNYPQSIIMSEARLKGLAYYLDYAYSDYETERRFVIYGEVSINNAIKLWELIIDKLTTAIDSMTEQDLEDVKKYIMGIYEIASEDAAEIHGRSLYLYPIYNKYTSLEDSQKKLKSINLDQYKIGIRKYFQDGVSQVAIVKPKNIVNNQDVMQCLSRAQLALNDI